MAKWRNLLFARATWKAPDFDAAACPTPAFIAGCKAQASAASPQSVRGRDVHGVRAQR